MKNCRYRNNSGVSFDIIISINAFNINTMLKIQIYYFQRNRVFKWITDIMGTIQIGQLNKILFNEMFQL